MNLDDVNLAANEANKIFKTLRQKYPLHKKDYLVFSNRLGQTNLDSSPSAILKEFPEMFLESEEKTRCEQLLSELEIATSKIDLAPIHSQLSDTARHLQVDGDVQIEIRFDNLEYDQVIKPLLNDPSIDQSRSPKGFIRVVLGTVRDLAERARNNNGNAGLVTTK